MFPILKKTFWFFGVGIFLLAIFLPGYTKLQELKDRNNDLRAKIKQLNIENNLLELELKRIQGDAVYREKIAREKMGVVRRGEIPVKIIRGNNEEE